MTTVCKISIYLAYLMSIYTIASLYYLGYTAAFVGTPFKDSLTEEQKKIKKESASTRKSVFVQGLGLALLICVLIKPFESC